MFPSAFLAVDVSHFDRSRSCKESHPAKIATQFSSLGVFHWDRLSFLRDEQLRKAFVAVARLEVSQDATGIDSRLLHPLKRFEMSSNLAFSHPLRFNSVKEEQLENKPST